jgi:hypothetical protein
MNLLASLVLALTLPFGNGIIKSSTVQSGEAQVAVFSVGGGGKKDVVEQSITTTVEDPKHPGEPWVVTSYRRDDESELAFVKRHREMVEAVREALK